MKLLLKRYISKSLSYKGADLAIRGFRNATVSPDALLIRDRKGELGKGQILTYDMLWS